MLPFVFCVGLSTSCSIRCFLTSSVHMWFGVLLCLSVPTAVNFGSKFTFANSPRFRSPVIIHGFSFSLLNSESSHFVSILCVISCLPVLYIAYTVCSSMTNRMSWQSLCRDSSCTYLMSTSFLARTRTPPPLFLGLGSLFLGGGRSCLPTGTYPSIRNSWSYLFNHDSVITITSGFIFLIPSLIWAFL